MDIDEEITAEVLDGDEYQLVLPSGAVIGHRSLLRYYKQRLNPNRALVPKSSKKLHKVLAEYRSLGWTNTQQTAAAKRARDIHHVCSMTLAIDKTITIFTDLPIFSLFLDEAAISKMDHEIGNKGE